MGAHPMRHREGNAVTPDQFKAGRRSLGLSVYELGRILNTAPDTIRKWEMLEARSSGRSVNPVAARVLHWLLAGYRPPEWPTAPQIPKDSHERAEDDRD
jgi:hypothetical protein